MFRKFIGDKAFYSRVITITIPILIQNIITNFLIFYCFKSNSSTYLTNLGFPLSTTKQKLSETTSFIAGIFWDIFKLNCSLTPLPIQIPSLLLIQFLYQDSSSIFLNLSTLSTNINSTMESVLFSSISKVQDDKEKVKSVMKRLMKISSFAIMPLLFGISAVANTLITILLTDKWSECVPYLRVVCVQQTFGILNTVNMQAIKAIGKSDTILKNTERK